MNKFSKISLAEYQKANGVNYDNIKLPCRGTVGSAGYDFFLNEDTTFPAGQSVLVPTGIRCEMDSNVCLLIFPRSSLGFKHKMTLDNTVGVIDSDYYYADNEGHIMIKMTNNSDKSISLSAGVGFAQGILLPFILTDDDKTERARKGGFGSTDSK